MVLGVVLIFVALIPSTCGTFASNPVDFDGEGFPCSPPSFVVKYGHNTVPCGLEVSVDVAEKQPHVEYKGVLTLAPDNKYSLLMIDPDAPSRNKPRARSWLHWLKVNIPSNELNNTLQFDLGDEVMEYAAPTPPKGSGPHRYIFLLFKQKDEVEKKKIIISKRGKFDVDEFVAKYNLYPEASIYFTAETK